MNAYLIKEQLYLNENLALTDVATALHHHHKKISSAINKNTDSGFFDYINGFRVAAFNEKIAQGQHHDFTILSIALGCGFGSKSSFNRAYKKKMGMTPSQFIASQAS